MEQQKKHIAILGSTGSIGQQALDIVKNYDEFFIVEVLTANNNADTLIEQAIAFKPNTVVIANKALYKKVNDALNQYDIKVYSGSDAIIQVLEMDSINFVLNSLVGFAGFLPTIKSIEKGKVVALANKESLVVGGKYITELIAKYKGTLIPVDSEHSAIFQCLVGEHGNEIEKIYLTASGGPFLGYSNEQLKSVTKKQALNHPNWIMGNKITIDSATLMNKGFEVIEAKWLFGLEIEDIEVIIHPQSIIHSIVQFEDGSMKAQLGLPNMKIPIQYAMFYPNRMKSNVTRYNILDNTELTFTKPDIKNFRNLALAFESIRMGGNIPCALNAANEVVVAGFLNDQIGFLEMPEIIEKCIKEIDFITEPSLDEYLQTDSITRQMALKYIR